MIRNQKRIIKINYRGSVRAAAANVLLERAVLTSDLWKLSSSDVCWLVKRSFNRRPQTKTKHSMDV